MTLAPHSAAWYDRMATTQLGYYYPWRSQLGANNGEDEYLVLVQQHLHAAADVLDAACGHGDTALAFAPHCRSVLAYDRTAAYIDLARQNAQAQSIANITFVCHDSSAEANGGQARILAADQSFDLLTCRKGPFHWLDDARRVARPGATLLMLVPDAVPLTAWASWLPEPVRLKPAEDPHWARPAIEQRLAQSGLHLHSWWSYDVPEYFTEPEEMYRWLTFGRAVAEVPTLSAMAAILDRIFAEFGGTNGVEIRQRRYVWKAVVPD